MTEHSYRVDPAVLKRLERFARGMPKVYAGEPFDCDKDIKADVRAVLKALSPPPSSHVDGRISELEAEVKKLRRVATDRQYMMEAYRAMLGPVALKVVEGWERKGVMRQHTSWGPEAASLTGEERAQVILDAEAQISHPLDFGDYEREALSPSPQPREVGE